MNEHATPDSRPTAPPAPPDDPPPPAAPTAELRTHGKRPFHLVWLIPVIAAAIAIYLGWQAYSSRGPTIVISFNAGDGIVAGQTQVRHKAVPLGTVRRVSLSKDLNAVDVAVAMGAEADAMLTESARFWVVRPRLTAGSISGLDTVLSGSYIEMDPGARGGARKTSFQGLEEPPAVRSGEPGTPFDLTADRIGSLSSGAPIFYRDIVAGEVLNYDLGPAGNGVTIHAFVRHPFDAFVHKSTRFWNASGVSLDLGANGVQLRLNSLQALLSGGIAFDTLETWDITRVAAGTSFVLHPDEATARAAGYTKRLHFLVYFEGSVRGLGVGAPVELDGIQVGSVTSIQLEFSTKGDLPRVRVAIEVQPERFLPSVAIHPEDTGQITTELVRRGLRAQLESANLLTGQKIVAFDFLPDAPAEKVLQEGDVFVIPSASGGGLDSITSSLARVADKLSALPLEQVARHLDDTLRGAAALVSGPEIRDTLGSVSGAARRLPDLTQRIDKALTGVDRLVGSVSSGYGQDSQFEREVTRLLDQLGDTARSVRLLADYLDAHPEALIRGRQGGLVPR